MPVDVNIWILAGTGFTAGLLGSMLGVGGGFLIVPILTLALGIPIQYAIGSSLVSIVINACTATGVYISKHMTNLKLGLLLACTLVPGAVAGAFLGAKLSSTVLTIIFGILMLYVAYSMVPKKQHKLTEDQIEAKKLVSEKSHARHAWLDDSYFDPAVNEEISYQVHRPAIGMVTGFFGGMISSMLGVGGGIINVPVMNQLMKVPVKATIATSSLLLCFTTMTGSLIYAYNGYVLPYLIAPLCISVYIGAMLGATIAHRVHGKVLTTVFAIFLILTAGLMILRALNVMGG
ncbi:MAG: sulfite exporter TauE/SafE family protein [Chloroflexi bacterium]|nr:sulfite exporter TauE/SafE family protein [Chloroflexota bacterium]